MNFISPRLGEISLAALAQEIVLFMEEDPDSYYHLVIGSDSQIRHTNSHFECAYVTAIVVHRRGFGARYFWNRENVNRAPSLREKIYAETERSLETARQLVPDLSEKIANLQYDLEIHVDVGPVGPTREMIKEVVGMVTGNGFSVKTKPESWAASSVADKHT